MPVTTYDRKRNAAADLSSGFGPLNTTSILFDNEEEPTPRASKSTNKTSPPDNKTYLQVQHTADGFPKLIRREDNGELAPGSPAALDLALSKIEQQVTDRATGTRHRISLPPSALSSNGNIAPLNSILANSNDKSAAINRRSMEVKFTAETKRPALMASPPRGMANGSSKSQASYSTNDIPTLKSIDGENSSGVPVNSPPTQTMQIVESGSTDQSSNSFNRGIPAAASNAHRQSQDFTVANKSQENNSNVFDSSQALLQGNAAPFSGTMHSQEVNQMRPFQPPTISPYAQPPYYNGYGMPVQGFNNMSLGGGYGAQGQWPNQMQSYQQSGFGSYQQYPQGGQVGPGASRYSDSQKGSAPQRSKTQADEFYNAAAVQDLIGQIYSLCKDQHGCRFLQRKLEERNEQDVQIIFSEVKNHFEELMIDPFGNYLCQRLLEYANDEQRKALVQNAVPAMGRIALNQHGTRALQRMIEFISTEEQTNMIIEALRDDVVHLIQDLNGNHVIQKCLNHLSSQDAQFIFDAVGANCVIVGTHRHGCCVLQRCVDHASGLQKGAMIDHIIDNAFALVQDPFGNYVAQYILDLAEPCFTEPLCRSFLGSIAYLSKQKFSSNVIEKCVRCAGAETKRLLIAEIASPLELERLVRDSFGNYVVQTAMEFADENTKSLLIESVRPIVPAIRNTPHGRRITGKIQEYDGGNLSIPGTHLPEAGLSPPKMPNPYAANGVSSGRGNRMGMIGAPAQWANNGGYGGQGAVGYAGVDDINAPTPQRNQAYNLLNGTQNYQNHGFGGPDFNNMGGRFGPNGGNPYNGYGNGNGNGNGNGQPF